MLKKHFSSSSKYKKIKGTYGEDLAAEVILNKWPKLCFASRNFRSPCGEVDLIFRCKNTLLLVEVKIDAIGREGAFLWSPKQKHRLLKSKAYLQKKTKKSVELGFCHIGEKVVRFYGGADLTK